MSRATLGHGSTRRHVALVVGMALAMVAPVATVSADEGGPPEGSGRSLSSFTEVVCDADSCTSVTFDAKEVAGARSLCVSLVTSSPDGATIYEQEDGCASDNIGAWRTSAGFITGVVDTTVTVSSTLGGIRDVSVSGTGKLDGATTATIEMLEDTSGTCAIQWTIRERRVAVAGTVTVDGVAYAMGSDSLSTIRQVKEKTRC